MSLAYYAERAARARVETAARSLKNAQNVELAAEERRAHGIGTVVEVAQARQATAQAQLLQVQAEVSAQDAYQALIAAMGISPLTRLKMADLPERKLPGAATDSVERIVADALGRRPDVLAAYAAQKASRGERSRGASRVSAEALSFRHRGIQQRTSGRHGHPVDRPAVSWDRQSHRQPFGGTVFAGITVPVYDGGLRAAVLEQARAKADNASLALTHTRDEAVRQIVVAQNALRTGLSAYSASTALTAAAETTFEAALAAYRNGVGSITDATVAETQLLQARNGSTDAYSAALSAAATLALAVGGLGSAPQ